MDATTLARVVSLSKTLGSTRVLDDVSLDVRRGENVGLIGANGAGKTTLIRILLGLMTADAGEVQRQDGIRASYLPEERGLYRRHRVNAVLGYLAALQGLEQAAIPDEVERCLARVGMAPYASRRVEQLSKGQQQKVQLAATLIGEPDLLVLDEPFSGLDPLNARLVCEIARERTMGGRSVLLSAHQLALVEQVCTHVAMLDRGRLVLTGTIEEIRARGRTLDAIFDAQAGR